ncbi:MAG: hypothetical protein ACE5K2_04190 [Candidatus Zixiibacteriota bacterium]
MKVYLSFILALLLPFSCGTPYTYKSPHGLWSRPHPDDPAMPYDTLAYLALWKGDPEAQKQLAKRDAKLKAIEEERQKQAHLDSLLRVLQRPVKQYPPTAWELKDKIKELEYEIEELRSRIRELEEELENK